MNEVIRDPGVTVHLMPENDQGIAEVSRVARDAGMSIFALDLGGSDSAAELISKLGQEFLFPYAVNGLDATLDLMSDLEWLSNENGYVLVVRGPSGTQRTATTEALLELVLLVPSLARRWYAQRIPFHIVIACDDASRTSVAQTLQEAESRWNAMGHSWIRTKRPARVREYE